MSPFCQHRKETEAQSEGAISQKESQNRGGSRVRHTYKREEGIMKTRDVLMFHETKFQ
jgi:hypothetical protein